MTKGILRENVDQASTLIVQGSPNVFVDGSGAVRVGDKEANNAVLVQGSSTVFVNGIAVSRNGDLDNFSIGGNPGSSDVFAG